MSTFDDDERSASGSRPIDLYTIQTTSAIYHITSHIVDVDYGGNTFTATTMTRGSQEVGQDLTGRELIVILPITHPLVQRYAGFGVPEQQVLVTVQRLQESSGIASQTAQGFGNAMAIEGNAAQLRVPSLADDAMKIKLPMIRAQALCNHRLFDAQCSPAAGGGPNKAAFSVANVLVSQTVTPGDVTLLVQDNVATNGGFLKFGEVHFGGEVRQCIYHLNTTIKIDAPFFGVLPGAAITCFAGCDHAFSTCKATFANAANYGGLPHMNGVVNPWTTGGASLLDAIPVAV